jgi:TolA-binding protein
MSSYLKCISRMMPVALSLAVASTAFAQIEIYSQRYSWLAADPAREMFNAGMKFYDGDQFNEALSRFRTVVQSFPKNPIADRADYYLIRTLSQLGRKSEALIRIDRFPRQYPRSKWLNDVQELRIQLTNEIPPRGESILLRIVAPAPTPPPSQGAVTTVVQAPVPAPPPSPATVPSPAPSPFRLGRPQSSDPEISLQQEIMNAVFRNNFDRALEIAAERLKANPSDPLVLSSLHLLAAGQSAQALSMLVGIVKNPPNMKARRDAIFWIGQSKGDKDSVIDTLTGLLPSLSEEDSEAVTYSLSQLRSEKSVTALAEIARDKAKSEKLRTNAVYWIGQSRVANRVGVLSEIYKASMDNSKVRQQVLFALNRTRDPEAAPVMGNVAATDPDIEVRKQAIFWLGQTKSPEAHQELEKLLQKK